MVENPCIWYGIELWEPAQEAVGDSRRAFMLVQTAQEGTRSALALQ